MFDKDFSILIRAKHIYRYDIYIYIVFTICLIEYMRQKQKADIINHI